jgi:RNA polymerase sigma-70 factor, ECF subfamily
LFQQTSALREEHLAEQGPGGTTNVVQVVGNFETLRLEMSPTCMTQEANMSLKPGGSSVKDAVGVEHLDGLFSYALVLTQDRIEAEDLVQKTYVRAIGAMRRLSEGNATKSSLFTILRNIWQNQPQRRHTPPQFIDLRMEGSATEVGDKGKDPHSLFVTGIERQHVLDAIEQLPLDFREVILLREFEELSYQEIAMILECPAEMVMSELAFARSKLRTLLPAALLPTM